jgi:hypothetical protein
MLRNRNSFFPETNINNVNPGIPQNMPGYQMPNNQPFYNQMPLNQQIPNYNEDIDSRIAKLERQINRLDARLSKLESASKIVNDDMSSSMYMV